MLEWIGLDLYGAWSSQPLNGCFDVERDDRDQQINRIVCKPCMLLDSNGSRRGLNTKLTGYLRLLKPGRPLLYIPA
jgi:hypothetical protein